MTTELQKAPEPVLVDDEIDEIPEMVAHIYRNFSSDFEMGDQRALCGIHENDDPHSCLHKREKLPSTIAWPGTRGCGCGARACERCFEINTGGAP